MADILRLLPPFRWKGVQYPVVARSVSFAHESVPHRIEYVNGEFREMTGAHGFVFRYTIPLREGIAIAPYSNLFNRGLPRLLKDFKDKKAGPLIDPIYGEFRCAPGEWSDDTDLQKRDGTDVTLTFNHAPAFEAAEVELGASIVSLAGVKSEAAALDGEVATTNWEQEPSPEPSTNIFDAVSGVAFQITNQADRAAAQLEHYSYQLRKTELALDRLENPQNWRLRDSVRRLRGDIKRVSANYSNPNKKIQKVVLNSAKTVSSIASDAGMTVLELIKLNPALAKAPIVGAGTAIQTIRRG